MINVMEKKKWYLIFSGVTLLASIVALVLFRLNLGVDFTGGTLMELAFKGKINRGQLWVTVEKESIDVASIAISDSNTYLIRTKPLTDEQRQKVLNGVKKEFQSVEAVSHETVGPVVGGELLQKAIMATGVAALAIVLYIAWAFRSVPKPASSWRFGVSAIVALLHDTIVVLGVFAIFGKFFGAQIDAFFVTAVLTIMGFSVHDTIVVFDRIRENLKNEVGLTFVQVVNNSIMQTIARSLNTSITVVLVLLAVLLFGGASLRWLTTALLVGIVAGTYSSIFVASPFLVIWQDWNDKRKQTNKSK